MARPLLKNLSSIYHDYLRIITKHGLVSAICGTSEIVIFFVLLKKIGFSVGVSHFVGFIVASIIGVIGHSLFTFRLGRVYYSVVIKFLLQVLVMLPISYAVLISYVSALGVNEVSKGGQLVTTFFLNVLIGKFITFIKK